MIKFEVGCWVEQVGGEQKYRGRKGQVIEFFDDEKGNTQVLVELVEPDGTFLGLDFWCPKEMLKVTGPRPEDFM